MTYGITVEQLPDSGAPQVGITVDGLDGAAVISVEVSWDGGESWHGVRGAQRVEVVGGAFFRDHVPPLNVLAHYRLVLHSGALLPRYTYAWAGAANLSESIEYDSGVEARRNLMSRPIADTNWSTSAGTGGSGSVSLETSGGPGVSASWREYTYTTPPSAAAAPGVLTPTASAADRAATVTAGETYTASIYGMVSAPLESTAAIYWYTSDGTGILSEESTRQPHTAGAWQRRHVTAVAPTGAARARVMFRLGAPLGSLAAGDVMGGAAAMVERASEVGGYFDGDSPDVPAPTEATITVASDTAWLQDPLNPRTAVPVDCVRGPNGISLMSKSFGTLTRRQSLDTVTPMGSRLPVSSVGVREAPSDVYLHIRARAQAQGELVKALARLFDTAGQVVIRGLPEDVPLDAVAHVIAPQIQDSPVVAGLLGQRRDWELTVTQVRPQSLRVVVPWWTYDQVREMWAGMTYDQVKAARPGDTYLDWQRDPSVP